MLRLVAPLFGFAVFGALFAAMYYDDPEVIELVDTPPKFRLAPEAIKPDFIEPLSKGENVTVNITVIRGMAHVYVMDRDNLSQTVQNVTSPGFDFDSAPVPFDARYSAFNVTGDYDFTFVADGVRHYSVVFRSAIPIPEDYENLSAEEREPYITEISITKRYIDREAQSLLFAYIMSVPSVLLVAVTLWMKTRRNRRPPRGSGLVMPRDRGLG